MVSSTRGAGGVAFDSLTSALGIGGGGHGGGDRGAGGGGGLSIPSGRGQGGGGGGGQAVGGASGQEKMPPDEKAFWEACLICKV